MITSEAINKILDMQNKRIENIENLLIDMLSRRYTDKGHNAKMSIIEIQLEYEKLIKSIKEMSDV